MVFEFEVHSSFNFLERFAEKLKIPVLQNRLLIPERLGKGYLKKVDLEPDFKFVMHSYTLNQDLHLKRIETTHKSDLISIIFNSTEIPTNLVSEKSQAIDFLKRNGSAIQIASSSLATETFFPAHSQVYFGVIGISKKRLRSLLHMDNPHPTIARIVNKDSFFFHQSMSQDVYTLLKKVSKINDQNELSALYYRIKVSELLYSLFGKLLQRDANVYTPINNSDLEKLYSIRTSVLTDLSTPPRLRDLSKTIGMSETKLKQLFKQVFGYSIYSYYQKSRMDEAAFLLKQAGYSVSEVGYQLGFTNLSHFSRLFKYHFGITPKKFSLA